MAALQLRWPETDRRGILRWIGSPQRVGPGNPWISKLAFSYLDQRGNPRPGSFQIDVPWSSVPALRLGDTFKSGRPLKRRVDSSEFRISAEAQLEVVSAHTVPRQLTGLGTDFLKKERSIKISQGSLTIFIPCMEIIRALFLPNSWMAHAAMQPVILESSVKASVEDCKAILEMGSAVPAALSLQPQLSTLALTLLDPEWLDLFRSISIARDNLATRVDEPDSKMSPLSLCPDLLRGALLRAVVVQDGDGQAFVERILTLAVNRTFPYTHLECRHPRVPIDALPQGRGEKEGPGGHGGNPGEPSDTKPRSKQLGIESTQLEQRDRKTIDWATTAIDFLTKPTVDHVSKPPRVRTNSPRPAPRPKKGGASGTAQVGDTVESGAAGSLGLAGKEVAFDNQVFKPEWPEEFRLLILGFEFLKDKYPSLSFSYGVRRLLTEPDRCYLLIELHTDSLSAAVLEVEAANLDDSMHWTVAFAPTTVTSVVEVAKTLIGTAFNVKSGWSRQKLQQPIPGVLRLKTCPHSKKGRSSAERIFATILNGFV